MPSYTQYLRQMAVLDDNPNQPRDELGRFAQCATEILKSRGFAGVKIQRPGPSTVYVKFTIPKGKFTKRMSFRFSDHPKKTPENYQARKNMKDIALSFVHTQESPVHIGQIKQDINKYLDGVGAK